MYASENRARLSLASDLAPFSPLVWWRTRRPTALLSKSIGEIRKTLLGTEIHGEADWSAAVLGEASVAIRIAVQQMKSHKITAPEVDLALSAVLACALEGEPASAIVISSALRRRSKCDPSCKTLSLLWLSAKF
jgi:hypothetical protein